MNIKKTFILAKPGLKKLIKIRQSILLCFLCILFTTIPIGWDGTSVTFFSIPISLYSFNREEALLGFLVELFVWYWFFYSFRIFICLLQPLEESFSPSQILWLRFTPCQPYEIAMTRFLWVVGYGLWLGFLSFIWALSTAVFHKFYPTHLLVEILGLVSYVFLCGGIVVVFDFKPSFSYFEHKRFLIPLSSLSSSLIFYLIYSNLSYVGYDNFLIDFFPYSVPTSQNIDKNLYHFSATALLGLLMLTLHVILKTQYGLQNGFESSKEMRK